MPISTTIDTVAPRTRAQIKQDSLPSSSRASSDAPTELDSTSTRAGSTSTKAIHSVRSGSFVAAATPSSLSPQRPRRQTRSTPVEDFTYGPQHLEHEYSLAYEELRSATIYALYRLGYTNPKRRSPDDEVHIPSLATVLAARFPDVERARKRINEADKMLREALEMGQTWHNTPWPNHRVVFDEKGMAVDVVEAKEGDESDEDENELREIWAKFETQVFKSAPSSKVCSDQMDRGTTPTSGRPKRKCREDTHVDDVRRRKLKASSSISSLSSNTTGPRNAAKPCALRAPEDDTSSRRRPGLRSANAAPSRENGVLAP